MATVKMKTCIVHDCSCTYQAIYESLFDVEILDDTFHHHGDGLISHGGTLMQLDSTGRVCVYQDYTMAFILAITPLHFLSLYSI